MAEDREVNTPDGVTERFNFADMSPEQMKALAVEILDRGVTASRFNVDLPPDVYGEWVPRDSFEIRRMQSLGFKVDQQYAKKNAIVGMSSESENTIGDVIFMTCPMVWHDTLDEEKQRRFEKFHGIKREDNQVAGQAEDKDYVAQTKTLSKFGIGTIESSKAEVVPAKDLFK